MYSSTIALSLSLACAVSVSAFTINVGSQAATFDISGPTACIASATSLASAALAAPTPTGNLQKYVNEHVNDVTNVCSWVTAVPSSLSADYSTYSSSLVSWYTSFSSAFDAAKTSCSAVDATLPPSPMCTGKPGTGASPGSGLGKNAAAPREAGLLAGIIAAAGAVGVVAVLL